MTIMRTVTHTCAQRFTGYKVFHIHHLINSSQQPCEVGRAGSSVSVYTDVETEAQRGSMTCLRPHSKSAAKLGPELGLGPWLSPLTVLSSRRTPAPVQSLSHTQARPCPLAVVLPGSSADRPSPPLGSPVPSTRSPQTASPELGPDPHPTFSWRLPWPGGQASGAGTSSPVFLSDPSPQGKRRERRKRRKRKTRN